VSAVVVTRAGFLQDRQGRTFVDLFDDSLPFEEVLEFFSDEERQRRMEESEVHHDRAPLAGVVREFESQPAISRYFGSETSTRSKRLRQGVGVIVRMIMERRGWRKTGRKGSLGVRTAKATASEHGASRHNTGGLALWFLRAERYELVEGSRFETVMVRSRALEADEAGGSQDAGKPLQLKVHRNARQRSAAEASTRQGRTRR
jgi:hypothetical protein